MHERITLPLRTARLDVELRTATGETHSLLSDGEHWRVLTDAVRAALARIAAEIDAPPRM